MDVSVVDSAVEFEDVGSSLDKWPSMPKIQRRPYYQEPQKQTFQFSEYGRETYVEDELPVQPHREAKRVFETETLRQWWIGKVLRVYWDKGYFEAFLRDLEGIESVAEFDIDSVFENRSDAANYLFQGSEFAFVVFTRHGQGSPETISKLEFTTPYIWKKEDDEKIKYVFSELFPEEEPLE